MTFISMYTLKWFFPCLSIYRQCASDITYSMQTQKWLVLLWRSIIHVIFGSAYCDQSGAIWVLTRYFEIQKSLRHTILCTNFCKSVNLTLVQGYVSMSLPYLPSLLEWLKFIHFNYSIKKIPKNLAMILAGPHFIIYFFLLIRLLSNGQIFSGKCKDSYNYKML